MRIKGVFSQWLKRSLVPSPAYAARRRQRRSTVNLLVEGLEDRLTPAPISVTSALDPAILTPGTLRYAINEANTDAAQGTSDTITFDTGTFNIPKTINLTGTLTLANTTPGATITIDGPAAGLTISGGGSVSDFAVFAVGTGTTATLEGLTIANGYTSTYGNGGGIYNAGMLLTVSNCTITGNSAVNGGGICNVGTLVLTNSTLYGNSATPLGGGGIYNDGTETVTYCTITGNLAANGGGGIFNDSSGTTTIQSSIDAGNTGGGTPDFYNLGTDTDNGYNMGGTSLQVIAALVPTDVFTNDPDLAPLGYYGGPTQTMPPLPGSPALSAGSNLGDTISPFTFEGSSGTGFANTPGPNTLPPLDDQRGTSFPRSIGGSVDIGAVESGSGDATLVTLLAQNPSVSLQVTGSEAEGLITAVSQLPSYSTAPVTVTLNLIAGSTIGDVTGPPAGVTLVINGLPGGTETIVGNSPALTVSSGNVIVTGMTLTTATDAPTILVTGGSLELRNDDIESSTGFADAAISVTGGTLDVGTAGDPGNNIIDTNQAGGLWFANSTANPIVAVGDTFEISGVAYVASTTIQVTDSADASQQIAGSDIPTDTNDLVSLRSAIAAANFDANAGVSDTLTFAPNLNGTTITLTQGQLELTPGAGTTTIDGGGQITVSGNNAFTVLVVDSGAQDVVSGLTISGGQGGFAGGIINRGTLTVSDSTLAGNIGSAGGIFNLGTLTVSNSTLAGNTGDEAGGIFNNSQDGGSLTVTNSTFSRNDGGGSTIFSDPGGGITNWYGQTLMVSNSSFSGNDGPGITTEPGSTLTLQSTIVAGNSANVDIYNFGGTITDNGYNLLGTGVNSHGPGDIFANAPLLAPLGNYGGPTETMALLPGSPAIGAGSNPLDLATDQRGEPRSVSGTVDIGAFEGQRFLMATVAVLDNGGTYDGTAFPASATVNGGASLEGAGLSLDYINMNTGQDLGTTAPVAAGSYQVTASFAGSVDYAPLISSANFTISPATPTVTAATEATADNGSPQAYPLSGGDVSVTGVNSGDDQTPAGTFSYSYASATYGPTSTRPTDAGTYTVTVTFASTDPNYTSGATATATFAIVTLNPAWFVVTSASDPASPTAGTLRYAVYGANLGDAAGLSEAITFSGLNGDTISLTLGALELTAGAGTTTIDGGGQITVSGSNASSAFQVDAGTTAILEGLTIANGNASVIENGILSGGGIANEGTLTLDNCTVSNNTASDDGAGDSWGGGIYNDGALVVSSSTISDNSALDGGGIFNDGGGTLTVESNSILSGNLAQYGGGAILNQTGGTLIVSSSAFSDNIAGNLNLNSAGNGGGIYSLGELTVSNSTFSTNSAIANIYGDGGAGGGVYIYGGTLSVSNSTFSSNTATGNGGGAVYIYQTGTYNAGDLTLSNSTLSGNTTAGVGGGIFSGGPLTVTGSSLSDNAADAGGGIYSLGDLTLSNSTLSGNTASDNGGAGGGGIFNQQGPLTVSNSTLSGNTATDNGGGVYNGVHGTLTMSDSTLSGNSAGDDGGGVFSGGVTNEFNVSNGRVGTVTVSDSTLSGNSAYQGGGIYSSYIFQGPLNPRVPTPTPKLTLQNTIVAANTATNAGTDFYGMITTDHGYNLLGAQVNNHSNDPHPGTGDIFTDSPLLGPLADIGGPTQTMALLPGSPAIGAGVAIVGITTDQRSAPLDSPTPDIGAYQFQGDSVTAHIIDLTYSSGQVGLTLTAEDGPGPNQSANQAAGFTCFINWGDGTAQNPDTTSVPASAGNGSGITLSHVYGTPGVYTVSLTATDASWQVSPAASAVIVVSSTPGDNISLRGGTTAGQVVISSNTASATVAPTDLVFVSGQGGADTYTVNFGSTLTTPVSITGSLTDTVNAYGAAGNNYFVKTPGQITWSPLGYTPAVETLTYAGIQSQVLWGGSGSNYFQDPGSNTTINCGPGANTVIITATTGNGVVINGGGSDTYIVDLGSLAGPVTINNRNTEANDSLTVNGTPGNNTISASGNQVTAGAQTITDTAPLTSLTVNGGSGNNQITVSSLTVPVQNLALNGGAGNNAFILNNVGSDVAAVAVTGSTTGTNQVQVTGSLPPSVLPQNITPRVTVTDAGGSYNGSAFAATATVTGVSASASASLGGVSPALAYYAGNSATGAPLSGAQTGAGTYTVVATYPGSADYTSASAQTTFTIGQASSTTTASNAGGTYTGSPFPASGTVTGTGGLNTTPTSFSYVGTGSTSYPATSAAPTNAGTYTVTASYAGDANHAGSMSVPAPFTIIADGVSVNGDVYVLNQTASGALTISGNAQLNVAGTLQVDSSSASAVKLSGNAVVNTSLGTKIVGGDQVSGNAVFENTVTTHAAYVADPLAVLAAQAGSSATAVNLSGNQTLTLNPGVYSSIAISGNAKLTLAPGTYVIGSGGVTISGNGTLTGGTAAGGQGVLIYNNGALTVSGNARVNLTAYSTGDYAGLAIFQARTDTSAVTISGNANLNLNGGLLYDANVQSVVTFSGNVLVEASLVVNELTISGNSDDSAQ